MKIKNYAEDFWLSVTLGIILLAMLTAVGYVAVNAAINADKQHALGEALKSPDEFVGHTRRLNDAVVVYSSKAEHYRMVAVTSPQNLGRKLNDGEYIVVTISLKDTAVAVGNILNLEGVIQRIGNGRSALYMLPRTYSLTGKIKTDRADLATTSAAVLEELKRQREAGQEYFNRYMDPANPIGPWQASRIYDR